MMISVNQKQKKDAFGALRRKKKFEEIKQKFDEQLDTTDMIEIESEKSAQ